MGPSARGARQSYRSPVRRRCHGARVTVPVEDRRTVTKLAVQPHQLARRPFARWLLARRVPRTSTTSASRSSSTSRPTAARWPSPSSRWHPARTATERRSGSPRPMARVAARQLTVGSKSDTTPRWSPDGRTLAFLSDRGAVLQAGGGRRKAGDGGGTEGGRHAGVAPSLRRRRGGATADRSAEGRLGGLVVAGRQTPVRRERRELDAAGEEARAPTRGPATARHAPDRHAQLPVQRRWIHP